MSAEFSDKETKRIIKLTAIIANVFAIKYRCNIVFEYRYIPVHHEEYEDDFDDEASECELKKEYEFPQLFNSSDTITIIHTECHNRIALKHSKHGILMMSQFTFMYKNENSFKYYRDMYSEYEPSANMLIVYDEFEEQGIACAKMFNNYILAHDYQVEWGKNNFQIISVSPIEYERTSVNYASSRRYLPFTVFEIHDKHIEFNLNKALAIVYSK